MAMGGHEGRALSGSQGGHLGGEPLEKIIAKPRLGIGRRSGGITAGCSQDR